MMRMKIPLPVNTREKRIPSQGDMRAHLVGLKAVTLLAAAAMSLGAAADELRPVGRFTDDVSKGENCFGNTVDLWNGAGGLRGLFATCNGLIDRRAMGRLEDVVLEKGDLAFAVRLSVGTRYLGGGREKPSNDLWRFEGKLTANAIAGRLTRFDGDNPGKPGRRTAVTLKKSKEPLKTYADAQAWENDAASLLRARGQKER